MNPDSAANRLQFELEMDGPSARLALVGTLSIRTTELAGNCLSKLQRQGVRELELDLHGLTRVDSAGVALLLGIKHRAPEAGWDVSMVAPPDHVVGQIQRLGVARQLPFANA